MSACPIAHARITMVVITVRSPLRRLPSRATKPTHGHPRPNFDCPRNTAFITSIPKLPSDRFCDGLQIDTPKHPSFVSHLPTCGFYPVRLNRSTSAAGCFCRVRTHLFVTRSIFGPRNMAPRAELVGAKAYPDLPNWSGRSSRILFHEYPAHSGCFIWYSRLLARERKQSLWS